MFEALADVFYGFEQRENELYKSGISLFFKGILGLIGFLLVDYYTKNILLSLSAICLINIIGIIFYDIPNCKKSIGKSFKWKNIFNLYKFSFPIFIYSFLNIFLVNSSKYALDYFSSAEIQNIFGIILMPGTVISLVSQYILNPFMMELNSLYLEKRIKDFKKMIKKISLYIVLFGIIAEVVCYLFGIPVLNFIYGFDLSPYKYHLMLMILGAIFLALTSSLSSALTIVNKNYIQMIIYIVNSIFSIILCILLVGKYEINGAMLVYVLIMFLHFLLYIIFYKIFIDKERRDKNEKNN